MALDALRCNHLAPLGFKGLSQPDWFSVAHYIVVLIYYLVIISNVSIFYKIAVDKHVCDCDRYVVAVGWDKHINVYIDSVDDHRQVQEPQPHWPDDIVNIVALSVTVNVFHLVRVIYSSPFYWFKQNIRSDLFHFGSKQSGSPRAVM